MFFHSIIYELQYWISWNENAGMDDTLKQMKNYEIVSMRTKKLYKAYSLTYFDITYIMCVHQQIHLNS